MREALRLAVRGRESVSPNPMVGALVVKGGKVVGRGFHRRYGGPHAEVDALRRAGSLARGSDLYVSLEPCAHHGKTPPCADAILHAGVARVFYASADPNPATAGRGPARLREAGVRVAGGLCDREAREVNAPYFHWRATGRPWVILKWAMTLDGKIATRTGSSRWITGPAARAYAHRLRRRACAVMAGTTTIVRDDPLLLPRPAKGRVPARVVLDRQGRLPLSLRLLGPPDLSGGGLSGRRPSGDDAGRRIYIASKRVSKRRLLLLESRGLEVLVAPERDGKLSLPWILDALGRSGISELLVEGGGELIGGFLDDGLAQEVAAFVAPAVCGGAAAPSPARGKGVAEIAQALRLAAPVVRRLGQDLLIEGRLETPS